MRSVRGESQNPDGTVRLYVDETIEPSIFRRAFGARPTTVQRSFIGSGTVWHELPSWERPSVFWESWLANQEARLRYEGRIT